MIPIYIKTENATEPDEPMYYLVAANGVFLAKKTGLYRSVTKADSVAGPAHQEPSLTLAFPRIPRKLMERIYGFFDAVYRKYQSEAIVLFFYHPERREYRLGIPWQTVRRYRYGGAWHTEGHVEYDGMARPEGFLKIGDIHSHGGHGAFFSPVDDHDDQEDGLRMVMGRLDAPSPDVCASFVAGGYRFPLFPEEVAEDFALPTEPPMEWIERVRLRDEPSYVSWTPPPETPWP